MLNRVNNQHIQTNSISFKKTDGTTVSFNGSTAIDLTGGINYANSSNYANYLSTSIAFTPAESALTPEAVRSLIGNGSRIKRGTWSYAGNGYISSTDTGFGAIDLAGTTVIQASNGSTAYTQLYITPPNNINAIIAIISQKTICNFFPILSSLILCLF